MGNAPNIHFSKQSGRNKGAITGGGLGNLDIGWLNSRNDNVGKEKEAELWEEALCTVQKLEEKNIQMEHDTEEGEHTPQDQNGGVQME